MSPHSIASSACAAGRCVSPICSGMKSPGNVARCSRNRAKIEAGTFLPAVETEGNRDTLANLPPRPWRRLATFGVRPSTYRYDLRLQSHLRQTPPKAAKLVRPHQGGVLAQRLRLRGHVVY